MERVKIFIETVEDAMQIETSLNTWLSTKRDAIEIVEVLQNLMRHKGMIIVCITIFYRETMNFHDQ